jgi:hypothetical protein
MEFTGYLIIVDFRILYYSRLKEREWGEVWLSLISSFSSYTLLAPRRALKFF